jgi:hypothetical protein
MGIESVHADGLELAQKLRGKMPVVKILKFVKRLR